VRIFDTMCTKAGYTLTTRAQAALQQNMYRVAATRPPGWANARSVRGLLDAAASAQAGRLSGAAALDRDTLSLLTAEDITEAFAAKWPGLT
jgi:hypothetical protein